ncbi:hypothetical protein NPIL_502491 [Nephila pilipes]|uniref:Uncharacterized protein n=1 Tax=Nephila pilipes TaxID=299642 RepID=A0A8X6TXJ8_NEPPI|nr:hypothetical protein NPIL_502491 [Nephila pilipes]
MLGQKRAATSHAVNQDYPLLQNHKRSKLRTVRVVKEKGEKEDHTHVCTRDEDRGNTVQGRKDFPFLSQKFDEDNPNSLCEDLMHEKD